LHEQHLLPTRLACDGRARIWANAHGDATNYGVRDCTGGGSGGAVKIPDDVQKVWREIEESDDLANNALGVSVIRSWLADAAVPLETELETNGEPAAKTPVDNAARVAKRGALVCAADA
jgi:hypothetical protein